MRNKLKICPKCFIEKPINEFYIIRSKVQRTCKRCLSDYNKKFNSTPEQKLKIKVRNALSNRKRKRTVWGSRNITEMINVEKVKMYQCKCGVLLLDFPKDLTEDFYCPSCQITIAVVRKVRCRIKKKLNIT
jgi:hypothetical protein